MKIRKQWGMVKKIYNLEHLHYGKTFLKNINFLIPWTLLKEKLKTGNVKHAPVGYAKIFKKI